ncbi:hypothetical protein Zmor_019780 [Zophobas morio]|uniref:Gustatory receptor n=1 Tax=Zophobas morio TaxID=2755281 RepID=A0AA38I1I6_9CUCU|nr:hypothetical protein Zmor_019780 [Zophobas morio]
MSFGLLSMHDINFMRPLNTYCGIFLIAPWYDFDKNVTLKPNLSKLYACALISLKLLWISYLILTGAFKLTFKNMKFFEIGFYCLRVSSCVVLLLVISVKFALCSNQWKSLFTKLHTIDTNLKNKGKKETTWWRNFYFSLFVRHVVFLIFIFNMAYCWKTRVKVLHLQMVAGNAMTEICYHFVIICFLSCVVQSFHCRYENINKELTQLTQGSGFFQKVDTLGRSFRLLRQCVRIFNQLFGSQILLLMLYYFLALVQCCNGFYTMTKYTNTTSMRRYIFFSNFCTIFFVTVSQRSLVKLLYKILFKGNLVMAITYMDSTVKEAKKFARICCKLQDNFNRGSKEAKILVKLSLLSDDFLPTFSAAGFFKIDKNVILGLMANVATYIIVALQLDTGESKVLKN